MPEQASALQVGLRLAQVLEENGVAYAIGGALAYAQAAIPRATLDVDLNAFVREDRFPALFLALRAAGIEFDEARARQEAKAEGMFVVWCDSVRVDVFVPSIDFSWEALNTRRRHEVRGIQAWFLSPEALAVFKLLFFRGKDLVDLERLVAVQGSRLDAGYIRRKVVEMMGEDDPRVSAWDRIVSDHMPR